MSAQNVVVSIDATSINKMIMQCHFVCDNSIAEVVFIIANAIEEDTRLSSFTYTFTNT